MEMQKKITLRGTKTFATDSHLIWLNEQGIDIGPSGVDITVRVVIKPLKINVFWFKKTKNI